MADIMGIDVSKYQGTINWAKVKASGKQFAILKCSMKNNTKESSFDTNYAGATAQGMTVGVYRYVYATTVAAAQAEANAIVALCKGKTLKAGVWIDMEDSSIKGLGKAALTNIINAEAKIYLAAGLNVGIYCNKDWYNNVLDGANLAKTYPFWIARYPSNDTGVYSASSSLAPKTYAKAWQYSSKGKVDGITGNVDMDVAYCDFATMFANQKSGGTTKSITIAAASPVVKNGSKTANAGVLQQNLNTLFNAGLTVDSNFGAKSVAALKSAQSKIGVTADGVYGSGTRASLVSYARKLGYSAQ